MQKYNLGKDFELIIDPHKSFQFSLKLISVDDKFHNVSVERRYMSCDDDPSHPARRRNEVQTVKLVSPEREEGVETNEKEEEETMKPWRTGRLIQVTRPGIYYCQGMEYDTDNQKYWIAVEEGGAVQYMPPDHPIVKNGYALLDACKSGNVRELRRLLETEKTNPNLICNAWGPVHHAAHGGHLEVVRLLVKYGADVDDIQNWIWITPLQFVSDKTQSAYNTEMATFLVALGADHTNPNSNLCDSIVDLAKKDAKLRTAIDKGVKTQLPEVAARKKNLTG